MKTYTAHYDHPERNEVTSSEVTAETVKDAYAKAAAHGRKVGWTLRGVTEGGADDV